MGVIVKPNIALFSILFAGDSRLDKKVLTPLTL